MIAEKQQYFTYLKKYLSHTQKLTFEVSGLPKAAGNYFGKTYQFTVTTIVEKDNMVILSGFWPSKIYLMNQIILKWQKFINDSWGKVKISYSPCYYSGTGQTSYILRDNIFNLEN